MRKPQTAAFGVRGVAPAAADIVSAPAARAKPLKTSVATRWGLIIKVATVVWVLGVLLMLFR